MIGRAWRALLVIALAAAYLIGATAHAARVNTSKARGDQSGYLGDAERVYANWHGRTPPLLIGERNRMPVYAGVLALAYTPAMTDDEFFIVAKRVNIYLSLALLAVFGGLFWRTLPPLAAANLLLVVAFGWFIFKAGYAQSELLFYFLFFAAFVSVLAIFRRAGGRSLVEAVTLGVTAGVLAALAHLTKAATLPFVVIALVVAVADAVVGWKTHRATTIRMLAAAAALAIAFLVVLSPYMLTNTRHFGRYFYNVNTTFYIWYDDWPQASVGTILHGDGEGWPTMPASELPSASKYWRTHTVGQIAARVNGGAEDMVRRSYTTYWYFSYVTLFLACAALIAVTRPRACMSLVRARPALVVFLGLYAVVYLAGIAFYAPISGTGTTRFLIAHLLPLLYVLSLALSRDPIRRTEWRVAGATVGLPHFQAGLSAIIAFDLLFVIGPRLMTTYGGF